MFKPAAPDAIARARRLRDAATDHERRLWRAQRELNRRGCHFRRQAPFDPYVLDFVEHEAKLVVELDGSQHGNDAHRTHDEQRDAFLASQGYRTLRFWNTDLGENFDGVVEAVAREVIARGKTIRSGGEG